MIPGVSQFANVAKGVGNYFGGIAREARDVPTAFGTNISMVKNKALTTTSQNNPLSVAGENNVYKQVKEVGGAFLGNKGTRSDQYSPSTGYVSGSKLKK
jgi:hypothetical protein